MKVVAFVAVSLFSLAPSLARADDTLVRFHGGIGVDGVSSAPGTATAAATVNRNIVRGVQPAGQPWVISDLQAEVKSNGRITIAGKGLAQAQSILASTPGVRAGSVSVSIPTGYTFLPQDPAAITLTVS